MEARIIHHRISGVFELVFQRSRAQFLKHELYADAHILHYFAERPLLLDTGARGVHFSFRNTGDIVDNLPGVAGESLCISDSSGMQTEQVPAAPVSQSLDLFRQTVLIARKQRLKAYSTPLKWA